MQLLSPCTPRLRPRIPRKPHPSVHFWLPLGPTPVRGYGRVNLLPRRYLAQPWRGSRWSALIPSEGEGARTKNYATRRRGGAVPDVSFAAPAQPARDEESRARCRGSRKLAISKPLSPDLPSTDTPRDGCAIHNSARHEWITAETRYSRVLVQYCSNTALHGHKAYKRHTPH